MPQFIGITLGEKERRFGSNGIATTGIVLNAAIGAYMVFSGVLGLAFG